MSKSSKRKKLTPEELKEENARIKAELAKTTEVESQQRITDLLSKENWIAILLAVLLPPIGIWYIWRRKEKHKLNLRYDHLLQLKLALNPEFSDEIEIFQAQTDLLIGTYGASNDPRIATASKDICYKFIEAIFNKHNLLSGKLIIFPFLGGWISLETHDLLIHNKAALTKYGLNELVFYQTLPLYKEVEKKIAQEKELSSSDKYVLSLYKHFRKD